MQAISKHFPPIYEMSGRIRSVGGILLLLDVFDAGVMERVSRRGFLTHGLHYGALGANVPPRLRLLYGHAQHGEIFASV